MDDHATQPAPTEFWARGRWLVFALFAISALLMTEPLVSAWGRIGRPGVSCGVQLLQWQNLGLAVLLLAVLVCGAVMFAPLGPVLRIDAAGIRVRDLGRRLDLPWSGVARFSLHAGNAIGVHLTNTSMLPRWPHRLVSSLSRSPDLPRLLIVTHERDAVIEKIFDALEFYGPTRIAISVPKLSSRQRSALRKSVAALLRGIAMGIAVVILFVALQHVLRALFCG